MAMMAGFVVGLILSAVTGWGLNEWQWWAVMLPTGVVLATYITLQEAGDY